MLDFRKALLLLAVLAVSAGIVSAQALNCTLNGGAPPLLRAEGVAEEIGQVVIQCTGGPSTAGGTINFQVFTTLPVTSRLLTWASTTPPGTPPYTGSGDLEATLLINDPAPGGVVVGTNAFFGSRVSTNPNSIIWNNITFPAPITGSPNNARSFRFVNIRVDASKAPASQTLIPTAVQFYVTVSGTLTLPIQSPFLIVGYVQKSLEVTTGPSSTISQCQVGSSNIPFTVTVKELFANAWRTRGNTTAQDNLNAIYNTESMFWTSAASWPAEAGVATQATRIRIAFTSVPSGVTISFTGAGFTASDGTVFTKTSPSGTTGTTFEFTVDATTPASAVGNLGSANIPFTFSVSAGSLPPVGSAFVAGSYAPVAGSSEFVPINSNTPRFVGPSGDPILAFEVQPCETRLLFPFVTSINDGSTQWDTGIAISNTSKDPFTGTSSSPISNPQNGECTLYFYGTPSDVTQTSTSIQAGRQLLMSMLSGNPAQNLQPVVGFNGYLIARCNFQYAHGYAFISDQGANRFAQGYIALVLGDGRLMDRFSASPSEALNQ